MILSTILEHLIAFIQNVIISPIADMLENVYDQITGFTLSVMPAQNVLDFCGACIKTFIPISQIGTAIAIILPPMALNLVIAVVLRVKSFVPTMGGK